MGIFAAPLALGQLLTFVYTAPKAHTRKPRVMVLAEMPGELHAINMLYCSPSQQMQLQAFFDFQDRSAPAQDPFAQERIKLQEQIIAKEKAKQELAKRHGAMVVNIQKRQQPRENGRFVKGPAIPTPFNKQAPANDNASPGSSTFGPGNPFSITPISMAEFQASQNQMGMMKSQVQQLTLEQQQLQQQLQAAWEKERAAKSQKQQQAAGNHYYDPYWFYHNVIKMIFPDPSLVFRRYKNQFIRSPRLIGSYIRPGG